MGVSMSTPGDGAARPVLGVFCVWHPACAEGESLARSLFTTLCADPFVPALRGLGVPVRFRTSADGESVPAPLPFGEFQHVAVFVIADDDLAVSEPWRRYVEDLVRAAGPADIVVPVALTRVANLPSGLGGLQAIRLGDVNPSARERTMLNRAIHDLCQVLDPVASKVQVFLSHAKHDGLGITTTVRRHLHEVANLDDFFDAADVPDGTRFAEFIKECAGSVPALLVVQTDTYASREWCRLEVLEAKRNRVPIVVLAAVEDRETRSFPYMGNVPVVRWHGESSLPTVVGALLGEVLRHRFFPLRVEAIGRHHPLGVVHEVLAYPPELLTVLAYRSELRKTGRSLGRYIYPDPPLGSEELEWLRELDPDVEPITPTLLQVR
jgi:hypothetical protein